MATPKSGKTAPVILDEEQIVALSGMGCTNVEMAAFFKCHVDTLTDKYSEVILRGRETGKVSVRKMMFDQGKRGNSVALKYLIHNILKEKLEEYIRIEDTKEHQVAQALATVSTDVILSIVKAHEDKGA